MSKKRGRSKQKPVQVQAIPEEVLAEGSGPVIGDEASIEVATDVLPMPIADGEPGEHAANELAAGEHAAGDHVAGDHAAGELAVDELMDDAADLTTLEATGAEGEAELETTAIGDGEIAADGDGEAEVEAAAMPTSAASMDPVQLKQLVEALVFASDKPITVQRLRQLTRVSDVRRLEETLTEITADYAERGLVLQQVSGGFQFRTRPQFSAWVQQLIAGRPVRLSRAQLETLAIIAYRQPITRPEIDDIRGVDSSATLKLLIDRALIRVLGKKEEVGRPMLYGTTREFLDFFSLGDLRELPTLREYSELSDESRKVMSSRLGIGLAGDAGDGGEGGEGGEGGGGDDDGGGGSSGSGGSFGGDEGGPGNLGGGDGGGAQDEISASSLSDAASHVLSHETDDETTTSADDDAGDAPSADLATISADDDAAMLPADDGAAMSADDVAGDVASDLAAMSADDDVAGDVASDLAAMSADDDAARDDAATMSADDGAATDDGAAMPVDDDAAHDDEATMSADDDAASDDGTPRSADSGAADVELMAADDDETLTVDAETRQVAPIIVEQADADSETRDFDPVTDAMTLGDAPDLERSEPPIVDPMIAAEVLAHAETIVSSGESPE